MQKPILCALALALSTTLAIAAEPDVMGKDSPMGDTTGMQAAPPKPGGDSMMSDHKMGDDKMGTGDSMKSDDKMMHDDKMMKDDDKMSK